MEGTEAKQRSLDEDALANWLEVKCDVSHQKSVEYADLLSNQGYDAVAKLVKSPPSEAQLAECGIMVYHRNTILQELKTEKKEDQEPKRERKVFIDQTLPWWDRWRIYLSG